MIFNYVAVLWSRGQGSRYNKIYLTSSTFALDAKIRCVFECQIQGHWNLDWWKFFLALIDSEGSIHRAPIASGPLSKAALDSGNWGNCGGSVPRRSFWESSAGHFDSDQSSLLCGKLDWEWESHQPYWLIFTAKSFPKGWECLLRLCQKSTWTIIK